MKKNYAFSLRILLFQLLVLSLSFNGKAQSLSAGDIAIIGLNCDLTTSTSKTFTIVALADLSAGQVVYFSDKAYYAGAFGPLLGNGSEGRFSWTIPLGGVGKGKVIMFTLTSAASPSVTTTPSTGTTAVLEGWTATNATTSPFGQNGDNMLIYQGTEAAPTFIFGFNSGNNASGVTNGWQTGLSTNPNGACELPSGLTSGTTAIGLGGSAHFDNYKYNGTLTSGTKASLLALIASPANWVYQTDDVTPYNFTPGTGVFSDFSLTTPNTAPSATDVTNTGTLITGQLLTGNYTYSDPENNAESGSTYKWYRSNDAAGTGKAAIASATAITYTLVSADLNKYISFEVTPRDGSLNGTAVESPRRGAITAPNTAPSATAVTNTGTLITGQLLTGNYTYSDPESNSESGSTYKWYRSDDAAGTGKAAIASATAITYTLVSADLNKYISFEVTPRDGSLNGNAVESPRRGGITAPNTAPNATAVTNTGTLITGQLLTGNYSYSDPEGNAESGSTYKWYRSDDAAGTGKAAIASATAITYTLVSADLNKYISFEVTPRDGSLNGNAVESPRRGAITAPNTAPSATAVTNTGTLITGQLLTGNYTYSDPESNAESGSTYKWYRSDDAAGTGKAAIASATAITYTLVSADLNKYISFEVTPRDGSLNGNAVESPGRGPTTAPNTAPSVTSVTNTGTLLTGATLTGNYSYSDPESNTESGSTYKWYRSNDAAGTGKAAIASATAITYTLVSADLNKYISFEVTPRDGALSGAAVESSKRGPVGVPTVSSINRNSAASSNATSLSYTVTFSTSITGLDASDFTLTKTGSADGTIGTPTGSGDTWIVPVNSITGDGTLRLDFTSTTGVTPNIGANFTSGQAYTLDHSAPQVSSINRSGASPTNATSVDYTILFSEAVTGVDVGDFALTTTGSAAGSIAALTGSGTTYTLTINSVSGTGTLRLDLKASGTAISDAVSNTLTGGYTTGQAYDIDNTSVISATGTLTALSTTFGTASANTSFSVSGANMSSGITITAPTGFEVSTSSSSGFADQLTVGSTGTISATPIFVRLKARAGVASSPYAGNITLAATGAATQTIATASSSVSAKSITLTLNASPAISKTYDAMTSTSLAASNYSLSGIESGDVVSVSGTASYDSKTIGMGKTITAGSFVLTGVDAANYSLTTTSATTIGEITVKALTLALNGTPAISKTYDGTTTITLAQANYTLTGVEGSDVVSVTGTATYDTKTAGTSKTITASTFVLIGADAGNYSLTTTSATTTGSITAKGLTLTLNATPAISKIYNGTTDATLAAANYTLNGIESSDAVTVSGTASYDTKTIGTGKAITVNSFVLAGAEASNYTLNTTSATTTGAITTKALTLILNASPAITKSYDGTTAATLASSNYNLNGIEGSDAVSVSGTASYDTKTVGTGKTITANTFVLSGADVANYTLSTTTASTTGAITSKPLTLALNATPAINKTYDGAIAATLVQANYTLTGIEGSDAVIVSGIATYDTKTIGTGKTITASSFVLAGTDAANYSLTTTSATTTGSITAKALTLVLNAAPTISKTYDGTTTATLAAANYTLNGKEGSDAITVSGTASYDTKLVGTGKTITANSFALAGADAGNYTLTTTSATTTGAVAGKPLTLTLNATPLISKTYDGSTSATLVAGNYSLTGVEGSDVVGVTGGANYNTKTVGTAKTITANSFALSGADAGNYTLTTTSATTTGTITGKTLTLALNAAPMVTKTYDASTAATLLAGNYSLTGIEGSDAVSVNGTATYDTKTIGTGKTITVNAFVLAGADAGNYTLSTTSATTTGSITTKALTLALNASPTIIKTYDGTTTASLSPANYILTGIEGSDGVNVSGTASFDSKLAGTSKTITADTFVLGGADAGNYILTTSSATTTGAITGKPLTLALNATPIVSKIYDGSTAATLADGNYTLTGIEGSDAVSVSGTATYDIKTIGTGKTITASSFVLAGADAGNYILTTTTASTTGMITAKALTLALNATPTISKTYDGTTTATLAPANYSLTGIEGSDAVTVSGTASYDTKTIGSGKTVTANSFILAGADAGNYTLTTTTVSTTGVVTGKPLTLALNATPSISKTYDGTTAATLVNANYTLTGIEASDVVNVTGSATYDTKMVGSGKTITANTFVLAGADAANYTLSTTTASTTGDITSKALTLALNATPAIGKIYDALTNATLVPANYNLTGVEGSDAVTVSGTASYATKTIGTGKTITANAFVLAGADAGNYTLSTTSATTMGTITARDLTLALNATPLINKTYDGTTIATLVPANYTLTGIQGSDAVTVSGTTNYDSKLIGTGKTVTANAFILAGTDAANYNLTTNAATTTGNITGKALTLALNAIPTISKIYDGNNTATLVAGNYTLTGIEGGDAVTVTGSATYDTKTIGTDKTITAGSFVLAGADAGNYTLSTTTATTTGNITARNLTVSLNTSPTITKTYDGNITAILAPANYTLTGVQGSDVVSVSGTASYDTKTTGTGKTITANNFVLGGTDATNYTLTTTIASTTGAITAKALTLALSAAPAIHKTYDGNTAATLVTSNYNLTGIEGSDAVSVSGTASYDTKTVGTSKTITANTFVLAGADAGNYNLTTSSATTTGSITSKTLTLALNATPTIAKTYDGTTAASLTPANYTLTGIEGSDAVSVSGAATYDSKTIGTGKTITADSFVLAGTDAANYTLTTTAATTTGSINSKALTLALNSTPAISKTYDGSTVANLAPANYTLTGIEGSDVINVSGTASYDSKLIGTSKTITANAFVLSGADAGNYTLTTTSATTTGSITGKSLTLTLNTSPIISKTYDGTTVATLSPANYTLNGIEGIDVVSVSGTASYDSKTVGTGKTINASSFVLAGADAGNYTLSTTATTITGNITARDLTLALNASPAINKTYDGTTTATLAPANYILNGIQGTDLVGVTATASYDTKLIGTGKTVTATGFVLSGADVGNYTLTTATANTTGSITNKVLTLALNAAPVISKTFDGNTSATLVPANYSLTGIQGSDIVMASGTANYDNKNVGTGKTITVNSFVLAGTDAGNYTLSTLSATTTGMIAAKAIAVSAAAKAKIYGETDPVLTYSFFPALEPGDSFAGAIARTTGENIGSYAINQGTLSLNANYSLTYTPANLTISKKELAITAVAKTKTYGNTDPSLTYTFSPALIAGDTFSGSLTRTVGENVGSYAINQGSLAVNGNYTLSFIPANLSIAKREITVHAVPLTKVYGEIDPALDYILTGSLAFSDTFSGSLERAAGENVGQYAISQGNFALSSNYNLSFVPSQLAITPKALSVTANAKNKTYGQVDPALTYTTSIGLVPGDQLSGTLIRAAGENAGAYTITQGTLVGNGNYTISFTGASFTIDKKALVIKADDKTKAQGSVNPALSASFTGFIAGEDAVVLSAQPVLSTSATQGSPVGNYPITVSGAAAINYSISYQNGILSVGTGEISDITFSQVQLLENSSIGTTVGQLASIGDNPTAVYTYSLATGAGSTDNALFSISASTLQTAAVLDFESKPAYTIRIRSTDQNGLTFEKVFTINLTGVNEAPTMDQPAPQTICANPTAQTLNLTGITAGPESNQTVALISSSSNPALFTSLTATKGTGTLGTLTYTLAPGASGTAVITLTAKDNGGTANGGNDSFTRIFTLTVNAMPVAAISSDQGTTIAKGETVMLTASGGTSYTWANAAGIISGQNTAVLTVKPEVTTNYTVTVANASGCSEVKSITLTVTNTALEEGLKARITNIMSPNGDGVNDTWVIENIERYPGNQVRIVDRAGRLIYNKKGYDNSWDATLKGVPLAEGTYYYVIDFGDGKTIRKGFITILRKN